MIAHAFSFSAGELWDFTLADLEFWSEQARWINSGGKEE